MPSDIHRETNWVDYLRSVDTPTLSNAIEALRVRPQSAGFAPCQTSCIFPEFGRMVGYAVTAQVETMTATAGGREVFLSLYEAVMKSLKRPSWCFRKSARSRNSPHIAARSWQRYSSAWARRDW